MLVTPYMCNTMYLAFKKDFNFMAPFYEWGSIASRLQSHIEEAVYFLLLSSQKFVVLIWWSTWEEWKAEATLEPLSGFEHGTPGVPLLQQKLQKLKLAKLA